jgi:signal transduction histidine kinase
MTEDNLDSLRARLEERERQLNAMHRISAALFSKTDLGSLIRETLHVSLQTVDADAGSILLYDKDSRKLVFRYVLGAAAPALTGTSVDPENSHGKAATVFRTGQSLITLSTRTDSYDESVDRATGYHTDSILTVPLQNLGEPIGVMQAINKRHGVFDKEDQELLEIVSSFASTSIVNASLAQEAQMAAVAHAVGDLSHDIKNALTPIETAIDTMVQAFIEPMYADIDRLIQDWEKADSEKATALRDATELLREEYPYMQSSAKDGCADIKEMVGEIADYIKGTQSTHMEVADVRDALKERLQRLGVVARNRRVTIHMEEMEAVPSFAFDRRLLGRAVFNLVNNALMAISDAVKKSVIEYRPFHIWVRTYAVTDGAFPEGGYCRIEVQDDGPGIPPYVKESLFTPRAISTTPGGTGIGTRFVKDVVDKHGGMVGVDSEFGCGATFWMQLPLKQR